MTVRELLRAYFSLGSKFCGILVQRNDSGRLEKLYSSNHGYDERYMRPEIQAAVVNKWGIDIKQSTIWITLEK